MGGWTDRREREREGERFDTAKKSTRPELRANNAILPMLSRCGFVDARARCTAIHSCHPSSLIILVSVASPTTTIEGTWRIYAPQTRAYTIVTEKCNAICSLFRLGSCFSSPRGVASLSLFLFSTLMHSSFCSDRLI